MTASLINPKSIWTQMARSRSAATTINSLCKYADRRNRRRHSCTVVQDRRTASAARSARTGKPNCLRLPHRTLTNYGMEPKFDQQI